MVMELDEIQTEARIMEKWEYLTRFMWANKDNWRADESIEYYRQQGFSDCNPKQTGGGWLGIGPYGTHTGSWHE
jgi:hypothetical protein